MQLDVLAIAPHPDDVELTCGGTLLKMAERGYKCGIVDLTRGEMGTRGTPKTRLREASVAARILRVVRRDNLGLPDARLSVCEEHRLAVARKIRELRPHTVILPYWKGRHPDHTTSARLGFEACFIAGLKNYDLDGIPHRPFKILYATIYHAPARPTFVVDITPQFERRKRAILAYGSQFRPRKRDRNPRVHIPLDALEQKVNLMARYFGEMIGVRYGEPFVVREMMQVDDVVKLPVRSI